MVQFLSINFYSWISSIFVGFFKSSLFVCVCVTLCKYAWFGFMWNSDISARKWTRYSIVFRLFIWKKLIHPFNQGLFCIPCRKSTHRTLHWKNRYLLPIRSHAYLRKYRTSSMNGNFTHTVVITNNNILQNH